MSKRTTLMRRKIRQTKKPIPEAMDILCGFPRAKGTGNTLPMKQSKREQLQARITTRP